MIEARHLAPSVWDAVRAVVRSEIASGGSEKEGVAAVLTAKKPVAKKAAKAAVALVLVAGIGLLFGSPAFAKIRPRNIDSAYAGGDAWTFGTEIVAPSIAVTDLTISDDLSVDGDVTVGGEFTTGTDPAEFGGDVDIAGDLTVTGGYINHAATGSPQAIRLTKTGVDQTFSLWVQQTSPTTVERLMIVESPTGKGLRVETTGDVEVSENLTVTGLTASLPVLTNANKRLVSGAGYWATFTSQAGATTANTATDILTVTGAGIATTAIAGDTLTVTATEADTLSSVCGRGSTTSANVAVSGSFNWAGLSTNTSSALVVDFTPDWSALAAGQLVSFLAHTDCADSPTLQVDSLTAKNIVDSKDATALSSGDISSGSVVIVIYDGTQWQLISELGN